jgi:DNA modification methylase
MINLKLGDCLELMKEIPDGSVDAIITDPPYGTTACKWDSVIDFDLMWEQLNRIIKPNGAIVLFGSEPFSSALRMSNIKNYKYDWVWEKSKATGHLNAKKRPLVKHELFHIFYKKQPTYNPQDLIKKEKPTISKGNRGRKGDGSSGDVYGKATKDAIQTHTNYPLSIQKFQVDMKAEFHPTQKPIALMEYLIKTYTNENELVLDFAMGSGSTMIACQNTNRNGIGIEMDKNYFEIATNRINKQ